MVALLAVMASTLASTTIMSPAASAADCVSKAERLEVRGTHYNMGRVHAIFGVLGVRFVMEGDASVEQGRRYNRCDSKTDLFLYYQKYKSDGLWHLSATL